MACDKVDLFPCGSCMSHAGFREGGRGGEGRGVDRWKEEGGGGEGEEGGRWGGDVSARVSHESCGVCMGARAPTCYSIARMLTAFSPFLAVIRLLHVQAYPFPGMVRVLHFAYA